MRYRNSNQIRFDLELRDSHNYLRQIEIHAYTGTNTIICPAMRFDDRTFVKSTLTHNFSIFVRQFLKISRRMSTCACICMLFCASQHNFCAESAIDDFFGFPCMYVTKVMPILIKTCRRVCQRVLISFSNTCTSFADPVIFDEANIAILLIY